MKSKLAENKLVLMAISFRPKEYKETGNRSWVALSVIYFVGRYLIVLILKANVESHYRIATLFTGIN